jgi:hypothetical protein
MLAGERYPQIHLGENDVESDGIGLSFLARHLVTLDFPKRTMYLKRTSVWPLECEGGITEKALQFLKDLRDMGQLPGWTKGERGQVGIQRPTNGRPENYPVSRTFSTTKKGDRSQYHYTVVQLAKDGGWKLERAWRTDEKDRTVETYAVP